MSTISHRKLVSMLITMVFAALALVGCNNEKIASLTGPENERHITKSVETLPDMEEQAGGGNSIQLHKNTYTYEYDDAKGQYVGGKFIIDADSTISVEIDSGALIPSRDTLWGNPAKVSIEIELHDITKGMIFTFDPHGNQVLPAARIKLNYGQFGDEPPKVFRIDDHGNQIPVTPLSIQRNPRIIVIGTDVYSRFALVHAVQSL